MTKTYILCLLLSLTVFTASCVEQKTKNAPPEETSTEPVVTTETQLAAPKISIAAEPDQETMKISFQVAGVKSEEKDLQYRYIHMSNDKALAFVNKNTDTYEAKMDQATLAGLDWSKAQDPEHGDHSYLPMAEGTVLHVVYAYAIDGEDNKSDISAVAVLLENTIEDSPIEQTKPQGQDEDSVFEEKPKALVIKEIQRMYSKLDKSAPQLSTDVSDYTRIDNENEITVPDTDQAKYLECLQSDRCDVWKAKIQTGAEENTFYFAKIMHMKVSPQINKDHADYPFLLEEIKKLGKTENDIKYMVNTRDNIWHGDLVPSCDCELYRVIFKDHDYRLLPKLNKTEE